MPVLLAFCLKNLRGKPDSAEALPIFFRPKNASIIKEAVSAHGVGGQSNHPWDSDEDSKASDALGGTMDATNHAAMRVLAENRSVHGTTACIK